ncbi:hypothetical protein KMW28_21215 [Flammeovirga yaeyamensis]|uniref:Uncharacterized protein n=1 Tax=Flammeovirga yaeyamensis TaxID=367791 RepID=A0AAX1NBV8_9BACT|nr:hypothetical protein [Flammeovirga yaeyamensis]MBB3697127.1 hypothetical protein [Flammeovirga yaeyamensis]NMF33790.1 hypothetical protein [Flammeovirga yaeyamensis]QWG04945.1 hypothetical protein KMW28_21215 [Flammeovirga yaeyamensis]
MTRIFSLTCLYILFLLSSCSIINWEVEPDNLKITYQDEELSEIFHDHILRFIDEAEKRDMTFRSGKVNIKWGPELANHVNATTFSNGIIKVNPSSVKINHDHLSLQLISHELYHLLCQPPSAYDHRSRHLISGTPYVSSLMVASSKKGEFPTIDNVEMWEYYFDELFLHHGDYSFVYDYESNSK